MKTNKRVAAFFDFDGTIYNGVVAFDFLKFLIRNRNIGLNEIPLLTTLLFYYILDKLNLVERYKLNKSIYKKINGWNSHLLKSNSAEFFKQEINEKFFPNIIKILNSHKKNNHRVIIVTSALMEIISHVRKWIKFDDIIATEVGIRMGIYTGIIKKLPVGGNRIEIIRDYCKSNNIDIKKSYAYSDHYSDIPLLENIGNPVAVNPDRKLRAYAEKKKWRILYN